MLESDLTPSTSDRVEQRRQFIFLGFPSSFSRSRFADVLKNNNVEVARKPESVEDRNGIRSGKPDAGTRRAIAGS